ARILARKCHSDCGAVVEHLIDLAADLVARSPVTIAPRITVLNHKIRDYAVNRDVAKIVSLGKLNEVVYGKGGRIGEQVNSKRTLAGSHDGPDTFSDTAERTFVVGVRIASLYGPDL